MAVRDSRSITLPGRSRFSIPVVKTDAVNELSGVTKATPEWMVAIDALLAPKHSVLAGGDTYSDPNMVELFGFSFGVERETTSHIINQLLSSAATRYSDLSIIIQNATSAPILEQKMNDGALIQNVIIKRFGNVGAAPARQILHTMTFSTCYITRFKQVLDYLVLWIRVCEHSEEVFVFGQGGVAGGSVVSTVSGTTGIAG